MAESRIRTIDVDASIEELYEIVANLEGYPDWVKGLKEVVVHQKYRNGTPKRVTMTVDAGVKTFSYTLTYTHDAPGKMSWVSEPGGDLKHIEGSYSFEVNDDGGTTVTYELAIDPGFKIPGFMIRKAEQGIIDAALKGLKKRAES